MSDGESIKGSALAAHEEKHGALLAELRTRLIRHLLKNGEGTVEDARAGFELPRDVNPACLGAVPGPLSRAGLIARKAYKNATRTAAHARAVSIWVLGDRERAEHWLENKKAETAATVSANHGR